MRRFYLYNLVLLLILFSILALPITASTLPPDGKLTFNLPLDVKNSHEGSSTIAPAHPTEPSSSFVHVPNSHASIPAFLGEGGNLIADSLISMKDNGAKTTHSDNNLIDQPPPDNWNNTHLQCKINDVNRIVTTTGYVPESHFEGPLIPFEPWGPWQQEEAGTGINQYSEFVARAGWHGSDHYIWHELHTNSLLIFQFGGSSGWHKFIVITDPIPAYPLLEAFIHLRYRFKIEANPLLWVDNCQIEVQVDGLVVFSGRHEEELDQTYKESYETGWRRHTKVVPIDQLTPGESTDVELEVSARTEFDMFGTTSSIRVFWDYIYLEVSVIIPASPEDILLYDERNGREYSFDDSGSVEFDTRSSQWTFRDDDPWWLDIYYVFNAAWEVSATKSEAASTTFAVAADALNANWTLYYSPPPTPDGWNFNEFEIVVPSSWSYVLSQPGIEAYWNSPRHTLTAESGGWHRFTDPNTAISDVIPAQQYQGSIFRDPCSYFMRGEQYAITPIGVVGSYFLEIYNPSALIDTGNGWITQGNSWTTNSSGHYLTIDPAATFGSYTARVLYRDDLMQLHVGHTTITFEVEAHFFTDLTLTKHPDGTTDILGQFENFSSSDYSVYVVSTRTITQAPDILLDYPITPHLMLEYWHLNDSLIASTGEAIDLRFNLTNTGSDLNNVDLQVRFTSLAGTAFTLYQRNTTLDILGGQTVTLDWNNILISPIGYNTTLRRGVYQIQLLISGPETGSLFLDQIHKGAYLVVTEESALDGSILAIHQAVVSAPSFTTTFSLAEMSIPGTTHFLAAIEDENHITAEMQIEQDQELRLTTQLVQPVCTVQINGTATIATELVGNAPYNTEYSYQTNLFEVNFFIDWGNGYQLLGSDTIPINNTAHYNLIDNAGHSPSSYSIRVEYDGNMYTKNCSSTNILAYEPTIITIQCDDIEFGETGFLEAQLAGTTLGPLSQHNLLFEIFRDGSWELLDTTTTNATGWANVTFLASDSPDTYEIKVSFQTHTFLTNCTAEDEFAIVDTTAPIWDPLPTDQPLEYGEDFGFTANAFDPSGIENWWINDTTHFVIDTNGHITNATSLSVGNYWIEIRAYDPFNQYCTAIIEISVEDTTPPIWITQPTDYTSPNGQYEFQAEAWDLSGISHWEVSDTTHFSVDETGHLTSNGVLPQGTYPLTITAYDPYNNALSTTITLTITVQAITGFPLEAILLGIILIMVPILLIRRRKQYKLKK